MPQFTEYPYLPSVDSQLAVDALITVCRDTPAEGEPFPALRSRLRDLDLWMKGRFRGFQTFFQIPGGETMTRSKVIEAIVAAADDDERARTVLADRLWDCNPILFKTVIERLSDRVSPPAELYAFIDSFAYRGAAIPRQEVLCWIQLARGLHVIKRVGIAFGPGERGASYLARAQRLDIDEYLEEDQAEPELSEAVFKAGAASVSPADLAAPQAVLAVPSAPVLVAAAGLSPSIRRAAEALGSPLGRDATASLGDIRGSGRFGKDVLADTVARLERWWTASDVDGGGLTPADFDIDAETWMEGSEVAMYRLAVAAAFSFRLASNPSGGANGNESISAAYRALEAAKVFDDLYYGTAPEELPAGVDSRALMLASLVARRCAEAPDLAATLERQKSAADAFASLQAALGRGLFEIELFWLMRALRDVGAIRFDDLDNFTALPTRPVRDALFRLGFLDSPYAGGANGIEALCKAAAAAHAAVGDSGPADIVLGAFGVAAGCSYGCSKRKACDFACRERLG